MLAKDTRPRMPGEDGLWHYKRGAARVMLKRLGEARDGPGGRAASRVAASGCRAARTSRWRGSRTQQGDTAGRQARGRRSAIASCEAGNDPICVEEARKIRRRWRKSRRGSGSSSASSPSASSAIVAMAAAGLWFVRSHVDVSQTTSRGRDRATSPACAPRFAAAEAAHRARRARRVHPRQHRPSRRHVAAADAQRHGVRSRRREGRPDGAAVLAAAAEIGRDALRHERRGGRPGEAAPDRRRPRTLRSDADPRSQDRNGSRVLVWSQ